MGCRIWGVDDLTDTPEECSIHHIPLTCVKESVGYLDDEGYQVDTEIENCSCYECEMDTLHNKVMDNPNDTESRNKMEKILTSDPKKQAMLTRDTTIIDTYGPMIAKAAKVDPDVGEAMAISMVSSQLSQVYAEDEIGQIRPNIGILWIGPSGIGKSPALDNGIKAHMEFLQDGTEHGFVKIFDKTTGPGMTRSLAQLKKDKRHNVMVTWDEVSTFAKLAANRSTSDLMESINNAYDGYLPGSNTGTDGERNGSNVYFLFIGFGTPVFLKYINEDFWDVGLGTRLDILPYKPSKRGYIQKTRDDVRKFNADFEAELVQLRDIKNVVWKDDMWTQYNAWKDGIETEVQTCQLSLSDALEDDNFPIVSKAKFNHKVLKYAIVFAAGRFNFTQSGILYVEIQDLERAIAYLEKCHKNLIELHDAWQNINLKKALEGKDKKILGYIEESKNKVALKYSMESHAWLIDKDAPEDKRKWVKHSEILKKSHLPATGYRSFQSVVETLTERHQITPRNADVIKEVKGKEFRFSAGVFYKITEENDEPNPQDIKEDEKV